MSFDPNAYVREQVERRREQEQAGAKPNDEAKPKMLAAGEIKPRRTAWMWHPYIPAGMISILGAKGGCCKGLTCASLAATVTTGGIWPDGTGPTQQGNVLWCEAEDPLPEVVIPRLIAAGADLDRITFASREAFAAEENLRGFIKVREINLIIQSPMVSFLTLTDINTELGVRDVWSGFRPASKASIADCSASPTQQENRSGRGRAHPRQRRLRQLRAVRHAQRRRTAARKALIAWCMQSTTSRPRAMI